MIDTAMQNPDDLPDALGYMLGLEEEEGEDDMDTRAVWPNRGMRRRRQSDTDGDVLPTTFDWSKWLTTTTTNTADASTTRVRWSTTTSSDGDQPPSSTTNIPTTASATYPSVDPTTDGYYCK